MVVASLVPDLVKNTLLRCFCHSCKSALGESKKERLVLKPLVRSPPRSVGPYATEIRATEESKGGIKYELVLANACIESPVFLKGSSPKSLSQDDIEAKLKEAQQRRQTLEALKVSSLNEKLSRLAGVNQKKEESKQEFQEATRQSMLRKLEMTEERRDAYIRCIQAKLREHGSHVEEVRKSLDAQSQEMLANVQKKLDSAAELRESHIAALQDRLKNHDAHIAEVRRQLEAQAEERRDSLHKKLASAREKRAAIYKELQERMQEKEKRAHQVRQQKAQAMEEPVQSSG